VAFCSLTSRGGEKERRERGEGRRPEGSALLSYRVRKTGKGERGRKRLDVATWFFTLAAVEGEKHPAPEKVR